MEYADYVKALRPQYPDLFETFSTIRTLEHVLAWMKQRGLPLESLDLIAQDEFCHELLIPLSAAGPYLVLGLT